MNRLLLTAVLGVACLFLAPAANAQDSGDPYKVGIVMAPTPYWGYTRAPYGLSGLADYTVASGVYLNLVQKAAQERENTRQKKLETRKKELEHIKWERNFLWDMRQEEAKRTIQYEEKRARERPPQTEVLAGTSLNWILRDLTKDSQPIDAVSQPIKQEWLDEVNFVATGGNAGLLRQKELSWPVLLQASRLADSRERVANLLDEARADVKKGKISEETIRELLTELKRLDDGATAEATSKGSVWGPTQHVMAIRYLRELKATILLLQNPTEAAFLLNHKPRCKTVAELVQHMRVNGLKFGPASAGGERFYVCLHDSLAQEAKEKAKKEASRSSVP